MVQSIVRQIDTEIVDVAPCEMVILKDHGMLRTVVGSGISVCLFNGEELIAGMSHFLFSRTDDLKKATGRYGNAALIGLHDWLDRECCAKPLTAYIAGGAYCDQFEIDTAIDNVKMAWNFLFVKGIPIVSQYIGGYRQREVTFDLANACYKVTTLT
jgi:chemotaxis protein CheD